MSTDARPQDARVVVGRVGRAHGICGDVSVDVRTDEPDVRFATDAQLIAGSPADRILAVASARWHSGRLLVSFVGVTDRAGAEAIRGALLEVDVDPTQVPIDPDEYYDRQLVGLRAVAPDGAVLGSITHVVHLPGHDLLAVRTPSGEERLVPFVTQIVPAVDLPSGQVTVAAPPGLFDDLESADG